MPGNRAVDGAVPTTEATPAMRPSYAIKPKGPPLNVSEFHGRVVEITAANFNAFRRETRLLFLNFYATWCPHSAALDPIWKDTAKRLADTFPTTGDVVLGRVDGEAEHQLEKMFNVRKYPTMKPLLYGRALREEYRGQRSVEAITKYVESLLVDTWKHMWSHQLDTHLNNHLNENAKKPVVIRYSPVNPLDLHATPAFVRVSRLLVRQCEFYWVTDNSTSSDQERVVFHPPVALTGHDHEAEGEHVDNTYRGDVDDYLQLANWADVKCNPKLREITFENGEEIAEQGLPLLILMTAKDDAVTVRRFKTAIDSELTVNETDRISICHANGELVRVECFRHASR